MPHFLPVRHHSPAAALAVADRLHQLRPRLILIEGPQDATSLLHYLTEAGTIPPVGILGYLPFDPQQGGSRSAIYPFCDYSPEYAALKAARALNIPARFFDIPAGAAITLEGEGLKLTEDETEASEDEPVTQNSKRKIQNLSPYQTLADQFGYRDYEEFWEAYFESGGMVQSDTLLARLESLGEWVSEGSERRLSNPNWARLNAARESFMSQQILDARAEGFADDEIAVVCGAAHVAGLKTGRIATEFITQIKAAPPARLALIPFSFLRLSEQTGYGAGNAAPAFFQTVWEMGGDFGKAVQVYLLKLMSDMQARGYTVSLSDAIEATRLAADLAGLRNKPAPGLWELYDVAQACYSRGQVETKPIMQKLVTGERIGQLAASVGRTSIQQEFYDRVAALRLPLRDFGEEKRLQLTNPHDLTISHFLHQLETADVPYATLGSFGDIRQGQSANTKALSLSEQLAAPRERWNIQWSPHTDMRLIELNLYGDSIAQACERILRQELQSADTVLIASQVLLKATLGGLESLGQEALTRLDTLSSSDDDFASLTAALQNLQDLSRYGLAKTPLGPQLLRRILDRLYVRALMLLPLAGQVGDESLGGVQDGLKILHRLAQARPDVLDANLLATRFRLLVNYDPAHPVVAGLACCILFLRQALTGAEIELELGRRLSFGSEPLKAAQFLEGLLGLEPAILLRNQGVIGVLNNWLASADDTNFRRMLPVLRRTFADLSRAELNILVESLAKLYSIGARQLQQTVGATLTDTELAELASLDADLADLLGEL